MKLHANGRPCGDLVCGRPKVRDLAAGRPTQKDLSEGDPMCRKVGDIIYQMEGKWTSLIFTKTTNKYSVSCSEAPGGWETHTGRPE